MLGTLSLHAVKVFPPALVGPQEMKRGREPANTEQLCASAQTSFSHGTLCFRPESWLTLLYVHLWLHLRVCTTSILK